MNWETIILSIVGLGVFGDILMRFLFKSDRRIADAKATTSEAQAVVAEAEAMKAINDAHALHCHQYEERIIDLHNSIDRLNGQLDSYIKRDAAEEARYDEQTKKLREVQKMLLDTTLQVTELTRENGALKIELERKRCDELKCTFRQPPTAYTEPMGDMTKEEYFNKRKKTKK